ncbi:MAG: SIS domain-containing protein [Propionibacteriales bacterium]|nr:SIS domain-containing protein [Propionibacteriales bacterium]
MPSSFLAAEIGTQPDNWADAADLAATYADVLPAPGERVAVIGCGTSLSMARAYAELRETAGLGETDAWPASAARLSRSYDRLIAISRSGTTTEVIEALSDYGEASPVTVVTSSAGTPILDRGDPIFVPQFDEQSVVQTRFATSVLALLRAHLGEDLGDVITAARQVLAEPDEAYADLRHAEQITFVGMGLGAPLAEEAALKLREATRSWTESYLATEYRHGPISISSPGRVVWAFGALVPNFERDIAVTGAHLEHRDVDPMADLLRVQRLCLLRAADRGIDPDQPRHLARSVILDS